MCISIPPNTARVRGSGITCARIVIDSDFSQSQDVRRPHTQDLHGQQGRHRQERLLCRRGRGGAAGAIEVPQHSSSWIGTKLVVGITLPPVDSRFIAYPRRWIILAMFVLYSGGHLGQSFEETDCYYTSCAFPASNAFQWTQLVIITNILEKYYGVDTLAVSWTSMIYMVAYIPLIFPASWFLQAKVRRGKKSGSIGSPHK